MAACLTPVDPLAVLPDSLRRLARHGVLKRYPKGHRLIEEGEQGHKLFIILKGRVRVFGSGGSGRNGDHDRDRKITYGVGEYVGELRLDGRPRSASVEAIDPRECAVVTRQTPLRHIADHPEFALDLLAKVIRRARAATLSAKQLALNDVYGRLVLLLLKELAVPQADATRHITEPLTHQEMANRLGSSREMVSRLVKDLEGGGYTAAVNHGHRLFRLLPMRW